MNKGLFALASGTFILGVSEYVMMGILPDVASALSISIPAAGHLISAYAIGVCAGAFSLVLLHRMKPKKIILLLMSVMLFGAILASVSQNYAMLLAARFIEGLPHGAYFGVSSIVALRLAGEGKRTLSVAIMSAGMTVANLVGNPLATQLSETVSWRMPFMVVILVSMVGIFLIWRWVPDIEALPDNGFKGQFHFLKKLDPWLILFATMLGNGGIFCWYSYINPLLQYHSGVNAAIIPVFMVIAGLGMFIGGLLGGKLSDLYKPGRVTFYIQSLSTVLLLAIFAVSGNAVLSIVLMFLTTACLFGIGSPEQAMIIDHAPGGEMLGGCCIQIAFNFGNALGAFLGGLPIHAGMDYNFAALVGVPMTLIGAACLFVFRRRYERQSD